MPDSKDKAVRSRRTVREVAEEWLAQHPSRIDSPNTVEQYEGHLRNYIYASLKLNGTPQRPLGDFDIQEVDIDDIHRWMQAASQRPKRNVPGSPPISSSTLHRVMASISPMFTYAVRKKYRADNPMLEALRDHTVFGKKKKVIIRTEEAFWQWCDTHVPHLYRAPTIVGVYQGLRLGELVGLMVDDIDFAEKTFRINEQVDGKGRRRRPKSSSSQDWLPLHPEAEKAQREHIEVYQRRPGQTVFCGRGGTQMHHSTFVKAIKSAGLAGGMPGLTPHSLRHTCGTWVADMSKDVFAVKALLRHSDIRTSPQYIQNNDERKHRAINALRGRA